MLTKQETLLERGAWAKSNTVENPGELLCHDARNFAFMVTGLVSGLSLASCSDSGSFLVVHSPLSQDGFQHEGDSGR